MELNRIIPLDGDGKPVRAPSRWFPHPDDPEGDDPFRIHLRHIPGEDVIEIQKLAKRKDGVTSKEVDILKLDDEVAERGFIGWKHLTIKGDNVPYDQDLARQMLYNFKFRNWVFKTCTNLDNFLGEDDGADGSASSGTESQPSVEG